MDERNPQSVARRLVTLGQNVSLSIVAVLLSVGLVEIGVRALGLAAPGGVATVDTRDFERIPGPFEPGQLVVDRRLRALPFEVRTNALGYRGAEIAATKGPDEYRVFFAGDSLTFGDFVDDNQTLPVQLEQRLSVCTPRVRVVNGGLGGSSIDTQRSLVERALGLAPDQVVLMFYENDVGDLAQPLAADLARNRAARARLPLSVVYPVLRRLATWNLLLEARASLRARGRLDRRRTPDATGADESSASAKVATLRAKYGVELDGLLELVNARRVPLTFATYPSHLTLATGTRSDTLTWVEALAAERQIEPVALLNVLLASRLGASDLYLLPLDGHPRPLAYRLVAEPLTLAVIRHSKGRLHCPGLDQSATARASRPDREESLE